VKGLLLFLTFLYILSALFAWARHQARQNDNWTRAGLLSEASADTPLRTLNHTLNFHLG
jgi:hypothetical protein